MYENKDRVSRSRENIQQVLVANIFNYEEIKKNLQKVGIFFCEFTYLSATENKYLIFVTKFALFLHIYFSSLKILATHASLIFSQLVDNQPLFTYADFFNFFLFETTLV